MKNPKWITCQVCHDAIHPWTIVKKLDMALNKEFIAIVKSMRFELKVTFSASIDANDYRLQQIFWTGGE